MAFRRAGGALAGRGPRRRQQLRWKRVRAAGVGVARRRAGAEEVEVVGVHGRAGGARGRCGRGVASSRSTGDSLLKT